MDNYGSNPNIESCKSELMCKKKKVTAFIDQLQQEKLKVFALFKELEQEKDKVAELQDQLQFQIDNVASILKLLRSEAELYELQDEIQELKSQLGEERLKVRTQKEIIRGIRNKCFYCYFY
jgi:septal ring factor EnvC (AmiA/AmiB activator)